MFPNRDEELSDYKNIGCKGDRNIYSLKYFHVKSVAQRVSVRHESLTGHSESEWQREKQTNKHPPKELDKYSYLDAF